MLNRLIRNLIERRLVESVELKRTFDVEIVIIDIRDGEIWDNMWITSFIGHGIVIKLITDFSQIAI